MGIANWVRSLGQFEPEVAFSEESMANSIPPKSVPFASEVEELSVDVPIEVGLFQWCDNHIEI